MHTPNQGLIHTFKFSAVLIICSLLWVFPSLCSLPVFSLPSFPTRSSQWCLWLTRVPFFPSLCIPFPPPLPTVPCPLSLLTIMSLPSFPIDDYVPTLLSYFRLCSLSLSLFLIMPWHSLSLMSLCYFCKIVGNAILCSKCLSERTGQLLFVHKTIFLSATLF